MTNARMQINTHTRQLNSLMQTAENQGVYTVASELRGVGYFAKDGEVALSTGSGYIRMSIATAKTVAAELAGICETVEYLEEMRLT